MLLTPYFSYFSSILCSLKYIIFITLILPIKYKQFNSWLPEVLEKSHIHNKCKRNLLTFICSRCLYLRPFLVFSLVSLSCCNLFRTQGLFRSLTFMVCWLCNTGAPVTCSVLYAYTFVIVVFIAENSNGVLLTGTIVLKKEGITKDLLMHVH